MSRTWCSFDVLRVCSFSVREIRASVQHFDSLIIIDIIDCNFPRDRTLEIRETPEFLKIAQRVRVGLRAGHSYDE